MGGYGRHRRQWVKDGSRFQFRIQNYLAFRTAKIFRMTKNPIRFSFSIFDLPNCDTFVTGNLSLLAYTHAFQRYRSTDVKIFVVSFTFSAQKSTNKTPKQDFSLDCQVVSSLDTMGLRDIKTLILQSASFPSSRTM